MKYLFGLCLGLSMATVAVAQDIAAVDGKPGTDIVSPGKIGDVHIVAEPSLANGRLVLHVVVVNRGAETASFGPGDVTVTAGDGTPIAIVPRETLLAEASAPTGPRGDATPSSSYAAPTMATNGAGQLDTTGYTGSMGAVTSGGVPRDTIGRAGPATPRTDAAALDAVLLKSIAVKPGGVEGGQVVVQKVKLRADRVVVIAVSFAGERHVIRLPVPRN